MQVNNRIDLLQIGDIVELLAMYQHHSATMRITKINRVSFLGTEIERSYGQGRKWRIDHRYGYIRFDINRNPEERVLEIAKVLGKEQYIRDM